MTFYSYLTQMLQCGKGTNSGQDDSNTEKIEAQGEIYIVDDKVAFTVSDT